MAQTLVKRVSQFWFHGVKEGMALPPQRALLWMGSQSADVETIRYSVVSVNSVMFDQCIGHCVVETTLVAICTHIAWISTHVMTRVGIFCSTLASRDTRTYYLHKYIQADTVFWRMTHKAQCLWYVILYTKPLF